MVGLDVVVVVVLGPVVVVGVVVVWLGELVVGVVLELLVSLVVVVSVGVGSSPPLPSTSGIMSTVASFISFAS